MGLTREEFDRIAGYIRDNHDRLAQGNPKRRIYGYTDSVYISRLLASSYNYVLALVETRDKQENLRSSSIGLCPARIAEKSPQGPKLMDFFEVAAVDSARPETVDIVYDPESGEWNKDQVEKRLGRVLRSLAPA